MIACPSIVAVALRELKGGVAIVVSEVFARRIAGWSVSASIQTALVLDARQHVIDVRRRDALTGAIPPADFEALRYVGAAVA